MENTEKNSNKPLVSVNICTYNRANLIKKALESVLAQDYPSIEIIIADSGSDETESVVAQFSNAKINYFKSSVDGISKNRNFALSKSTGKYIAVLDSDDYWISNDKISRQVNFLEQNPDCALVGTNAIIVNSADEKINEIKNNADDAKIRQTFLLKNQFVHSSVIFKKSAVDKYDEEIFIWEDYELFLRLARQSKVANLQNLMTAYKKHSTNVSNKNKIRGVKTLTKILRQNKKYYPNYYRAVLKNWGRFGRALLPF